MQQTTQSPLNKSQNSEVIEKIELFIQQHEFVTIPSIVFEYLSKESTHFDENDLLLFFEQFGEIEEFILNGKVCIVLFKTFFSANTCREFLNNEHNFINNKKKDINVRWFNFENDSKLISDEMRNNYQQISIKNLLNLQRNLISMTLNNKNNNINSNGKTKLNNNNNIIEFNTNIQNQFISQNINDINTINIINQNNLSINMQNIYYNNILNNQNIIQNNNNLNKKIQNVNNPTTKNFEKNQNKLTCKFEILIPNDKDFNIARRLIGSKGCNMKKIIDECKLIDNNKNNDNDNENIKLRLRGKGSGYKEGINNKESDEPLHLCISTKNLEVMKKACECVNDLFNKIYDDYKIYCLRMNINPVSKIAKKIDGGKNSLKYSDFI